LEGTQIEKHTDVIALKVKQEFAAKEKAKREAANSSQNGQKSKNCIIIFGEPLGLPNLTLFIVGFAPGGQTTFPRSAPSLFNTCGAYMARNAFLGTDPKA
jgi:hypothetical protein